MVSMNRTPHFLKPATATARNLPFAGIGFALDDVRRAASSMTLCQPEAPAKEPMPLHAPHRPWQASGYELLVTLGREIRGR